MNKIEFFEHVMTIPESGCWIWMDNGRHRYGQLTINGRRWFAHRYSWTIHNGEIPHERLVLHKCDTPPCVNPEHLFLGTTQDNVTDKCNKGRYRGAIGEHHGMSKLTDEQVFSIISDNRLHREIAIQYVISRQTVSRIKSGSAWKHIK